jgi:hypothetical protein
MSDKHKNLVVDQIAHHNIFKISDFTEIGCKNPRQCLSSKSDPQERVANLAT